jgi:hypothetical protein
VDLESTKPSGGLWGEVAMEVRATAFLRDVQFQWESTNLVAHGLVVGEAARPLDLYLLAGQRFLTHQQVLPAPEGQSFEIVGDLGGMLKQKTVNARVELVDAATIWYVVRGIVERRQSNGCGDSSKE